VNESLYKHFLDWRNSTAQSGMLIFITYWT